MELDPGTFLFDGPVVLKQEDITCQICFQIKRNPSIANGCVCGISYCSACLTQSIHILHSCPTCRGESDGIVPDLSLKRAILESIVRCNLHQQCSWTGPLENFETHRILLEHADIIEEIIVEEEEPPRAPEQVEPEPPAPPNPSRHVTWGEFWITTAVGMVPIVGPTANAAWHFYHGEYVMGTVNLGFAALDVYTLGSSKLIENIGGQAIKSGAEAAVTKQAVAVATKEVAKEASKEIAKEVAKEATESVIKSVVTTTTKKRLLDIVVKKGVEKKVVEEVAKQGTVGLAKEVTKQTLRKGAVRVTQKVAKEVIGVTVKKVAEEAAKETAKETAKKALKIFAKAATKEATKKEGIKAVSKSAIEKVAATTAVKTATNAVAYAT